MRDRLVWFKQSKFGWALIISLFAVSFFVAASLIAGILAIPAFIVNLDEDGVNAILTIIFPLVLVASVVGYSKLLAKKRVQERVSVREILKLRAPKRKAWWLTPVVLFSYLFVLIIAMSILQAVSPETANKEQEVATTINALGGWRLAISMVGVVLLTPLAEEFFFRGLLFWLYGQRLKIGLSIFLVGLIFGLAHMQINVSTDTFLFGVSLAFLTWQTQSIYPAIGLHVLKNSLALLVVLNK